jgi:hypothetical protein
MLEILLENARLKYCRCKRKENKPFVNLRISQDILAKSRKCLILPRYGMSVYTTSTLFRKYNSITPKIFPRSKQSPQNDVSVKNNFSPKT